VSTKTSSRRPTCIFQDSSSKNDGWPWSSALAPLPHNPPREQFATKNRETAAKTRLRLREIQENRRNRREKPNGTIRRGLKTPGKQGAFAIRKIAVKRKEIAKSATIPPADPVWRRHDEDHSPALGEAAPFSRTARAFSPVGERHFPKWQVVSRQSGDRCSSGPDFTPPREKPTPENLKIRGETTHIHPPRSQRPRNPRGKPL